MVKGLVVAQVRERFGVLFKLYNVSLAQQQIAMCNVRIGRAFAT